MTKRQLEEAQGRASNWQAQSEVLTVGNVTSVPEKSASFDDLTAQQ
jgi:hypothetical protein